MNCSLENFVKKVKILIFLSPKNHVDFWWKRYTHFTFTNELLDIISISNVYKTIICQSAIIICYLPIKLFLDFLKEFNQQLAKHITTNTIILRIIRTAAANCGYMGYGGVTSYSTISLLILSSTSCLQESTIMIYDADDHTTMIVCIYNI